MKVIKLSTPRWRIALYLAFSLLPCTIGLIPRDRSDPDAWQLELALIFFGLCSALFAWLLVSPGRLLLDAEGFTVKGGFGLIPWKVRWRDVGAFVPFEYPGGRRVVGFRYAPGKAHPSRRRFTRWAGADEVLPIWGRSPEKIIDQLDAYRAQALAAEHAAAKVP